MRVELFCIVRAEDQLILLLEDAEALKHTWTEEDLGLALIKLI
jgi:hypothetical protein